MNTTFNPQAWTKFAASVTQNDMDIEKAFLDQAWAQVQNKATPLMKPAHRVGFEIIHKNDNNTRMVGAFVFRVNQDYLFVPVFFINGSIKGTDLLYRANVKRFVPLTNEWCDYLIQLQTFDEGQGVSQKMRQQTRDQVNLLDIVEPPQMFRHTRKYASVGNEAEIRAMADEMLAKMASIPGMPERSILREFIVNHGRHAAIVKIANTAKHDTEFARALMLSSDADHYMPELPDLVTKAAKSPVLTVHTSVLRNPRVKKASPEIICQGFMIEDHRKLAALNEVVYSDNEKDLASLDGPGIYEVLMADGSTRRCLVGFEFDVDICRNAPKAGLDRLRLVIVDQDSRASDLVSPRQGQQVFGKFVEKLDAAKELIELSAAEKGQAYRMFNSKTQGFSSPFYVLDITTDPSGLKALQVVPDDDKDTPRSVLVNPDYEDYDAKDNIFGKYCKLCRVDFKLSEPNSYNGGHRVEYNTTLGIGGKHTLNSFIFDQGFKAASVRMQSNGRFLIKSARTQERWTPELSELSARVRLMLDCSVPESVAKDMLKQAAETTGPAKFFYETKAAHNLRFNDWPDFYERTNDEFGVLEQPRSNYILEVDEDQPIIEPHRVGDVWRQESGSDTTLDTMTPMQLFDLAQNKGIGSLFEHGVVGELVKTFDSSAMIQTYIPDFEQALDRLGRVLFLFYWKPEDFAQAYGTDDQTSLENKLISNFKSIGDLTLELMQKSKLQQQGTVSLT